MDFKKLITLITALLTIESLTDEQKTNLETAKTDLEKGKEEFDTLKTDSSALEAMKTSLGDKDLGELIGFADAMKKADLDSVEKVIELKKKADTSDSALEKLKKEKGDLEQAVADGIETVAATQAESDQKLLLADVKVALASEAGQKKLFDLAVNNEMAAKKFTRDDDGDIRYDGKKIPDAMEGLRKEYGAAFKALPGGTGNPGGGGGNQPQQKPKLSIREQLNAKLKN